MGREFRILSTLHAAIRRARGRCILRRRTAVIGAPFYVMERIAASSCAAIPPAGSRSTPATGARAAARVDRQPGATARARLRGARAWRSRQARRLRRAAGAGLGRAICESADRRHRRRWSFVDRLAGGEHCRRESGRGADPQRLQATTTSCSMPRTISTRIDRRARLGDGHHRRSADGSRQLAGLLGEPGDGPELQAIRMLPTHLPGSLSRARSPLPRTRRPAAVTLGDFRFYRVFGLFRLAVIVQQIYYRYHHGPDPGRAFPGAGPDGPCAGPQGPG